MNVEPRELGELLARHGVELVFDGRSQYVCQSEVLAAMSSELRAARQEAQRTDRHSSAESLLTVDAAAEWLSISVSKLYQLIAENQVATITIGRSRRVPVEALRAFVADRRKR
jgi:excisionase family DNA binding protein